VHHFGKTGSSVRGSSAFVGNADYVMTIENEGELQLAAAREAEAGTIGGFDLKKVTLRLDDDGDEITSCYIDEIDLSALPSLPGSLSQNAETLAVLVSTSAQSGPVPMAAIRKAFRASRKPGEKPRTIEQAFDRAVKEAVGAGRIEKQGKGRASTLSVPAKLR